MQPSIDTSHWPRSGLLAAAPPLVLALGTLLSLAWRGLELGGDLLLFPLPTVLTSGVVLGGAFVGLMGFKLRHPTWGVFALSTLSYLSVAALAGDAISPGGVTVAEAPLSGFLRVGWLVLGMVFAFSIGGRDTRRALWFFALFLAGEVTHLPVLGSPGGAAGDPSLLVKLALAAVVLAESLAVAWAVAVFARGVERVAFWVLIGLLALHPFLVAWPLVFQEDGGPSAYLLTGVAGGVFLGLLMAMTFALQRLAVGLRQRME